MLACSFVCLLVRCIVGDFKHNFIVEIVPICKDDLVVLPKELARNLADVSPMVLVKGISAALCVVDPLTGERRDISTDKYWRYEFPSLMSSREVAKYIVLSVEPIINTTSMRPSNKKRGTGSDRKVRLAEVTVAREKDFGMNDTQFTCVTHLGNILREGDTVLGYDLASASWTKELDANKILVRKDLPDVVLVRKQYPPKGKGERAFQLRTLDAQRDESGGGGQKAKDETAMEEDFEEFLDQLEGDKEMRVQVNLYKPAAKGEGGQGGQGGRSKRDDGMAKSRAGQAKSRKEERNARHGPASELGGQAGMRASKMEMEDDMRARGDALRDDEDEEDDEDDERLRLDELLDELDLLDPEGEGEEPSALAADSRILTAEEAAQVAPMQVATSGFDAADYAPDQFRFT